MGFLFSQFASLKHFRQHLSGEITHHNVWAAEKTGNYVYYPRGIPEIFTKKIYVSEESVRRKKYFAELSKSSPTGRSYSHESGEYGDYEFFFKVDLRKVNLEELLKLEIVAQNDSAYRVVVERVVEPVNRRYGIPDNGERFYFSHISLKGLVEISVENKEGTTSPIPDIFPYKEFSSVFLDDKCVEAIDYVCAEEECNHFVRKILKQEVALFIKEVSNIRKLR